MATKNTVSFHLAEVVRVLCQELPNFKVFPIVAGPNSGVFIDSEKDYPRGTRVSFDMTICPADPGISRIILSGMTVESSARTRRRNKTWYVFVAKHDGAMFDPADLDGANNVEYWGNFFGMDHIVGGEFCPDTREGRLSDIVNCINLLQ